MYEVIFIGNYVKSMNVKGHHSRRNMIQRELLRMKNIRLCGFVIQCDIKIEAWGRDVAVIDKTKNNVKTVDVAILGDIQMNEREVGKIEK